MDSLAPPEPDLSLFLLGSFVLRRAGQPTATLPRRAQALLALLALHGRPISREYAADMLWTQSGPEQARHSLRQALLALRRVLGSEIIQTEAQFVSVAPGTMTVDVLDFDARSSSDRLADLIRCAELYQGEFLEGLGSTSSRFDEWLEDERRRLATAAAGAFRRLTDAQSAAGDLGGALAAARRLIGLDDLDEDAHRRVIRLLAQSGQRGEALRHFEYCTDTLKRELGIAPQPETIELARAIRSHKESALVSQGLAPPTEQNASLPVADVSQPASPRHQQPRHRTTWGRIAVVLAALCVIAAAFGLAANRPQASSEGDTLLIVPFANDSKVEAQDTAIAGISSLLAAELEETRSFRVSQYRADTADATQVRHHIAANPTLKYIVGGRGSFSRTLDIAVQLSDRDGLILWSNHYARPRGGVLQIVDDISEQISRAVSTDRALVQNGAAPPEDARQMSRELVALSNVVRDPRSDSSRAAFEEIVKKAVGLDGENPEALVRLANIHLSHFTISMDRGYLAEADRYLERALTADPTNVHALSGRCYLLRIQHRIADSLALCRRALDINPHYAETLQQIGQDLLALHAPADAIPWFRAAIEAAPSNPFLDLVYSAIAEAEVEQQHTEKALAAAYDAVQHDRWASFARVRLAAILEIAGRHEEARSALVQFYQEHPEFAAPDGIGLRLINRFSMRPQIADALNRLGVKATKASDD